MLLPASLDRFIAETAPEHDEIQAEMAAYASEQGFPIIGRAAGAFLRSVAEMREADRIFEFGSGFGYSATWFLKGLSADGEIVLTEVDQDELDLAEEYLARAEELPRVHLEAGDALDIVDRYDGPFDVVLVDHRKAEYAAAFERISGKMAPGGVVIADNILEGPVRYDDLLPYVETDRAPPTDPSAAGLLEYLETVEAHQEFHSLVLPLGKGLSVATHCPQ